MQSNNGIVIKNIKIWTYMPRLEVMWHSSFSSIMEL